MSSFLRISSTATLRLVRFNRRLFNTQPEISGTRICPFCKHVEIFPTSRNIGVIYHNDIQHAQYSTSANVNENLAKKSRKKRRPPTQFVEIIRAGDKNKPAVAEGRAAVKRPSPVRVLKKLGISTSMSTVANTSISNLPEISENELLPNFSEMDLDQHDPNYFHDLSSGNPCGEMFYENEAIADEVIAEDEIINDLATEAANVFIETEKKKVAKKEKKISLKRTKKKKKPQLSEDRLKQIEKEIKRERLQRNMLPYLDVCINSDMVSVADKSLFHFHRKNRKTLPLNDIRLYNTLLRGWAAQGKWSPFSTVLMVMEQQNPQPNLESYVLAIECAYRSKKRQLIDDILAEIKAKGFDIKNLLLECKFVGNQKDLILRAIRSKIPDFSPLLPKQSHGYVCDLLKPLNGTENEKKNISSSMPVMSREKLNMLTERQLETEIRGQLKVRSIEKKPPISAYTIAWRRKLNKLESTWYDVLNAEFDNSLTALEEEAKLKRTKKTDMLPYLKALKKDVYVDLMFQEITAWGQLSEAYSPVVSSLQKSLGLKIMERYLLQKKEKLGILKEIKKYYSDYGTYFTDSEINLKYTPRKYWQHLEAKYSNGPDIDQQEKLWPTYVLIGVGEFLYDIILKHIKFDKNLLTPGSKTEKLAPAFYSIYRSHDLVKLREELKPHPGLVKLYKKANKDELTFEASLLPMLSPPLPWTSINCGGFILSSTKIIRFPEMATQQRNRLEQMDEQKLYPAFDSLNQLSECPWIINKRILDHVIEVFNNKGSEELDIPCPTSECPDPPKILLNMTKREIAKVVQEQNRLKQKKAEMYSLWCDMLYKLSIANHFRDEVIWFPHNMDFRGRVYPCPPHFNHLGSDVSRSLLLFARGEPLGEEGLKWLKIHLVNLTGLKKRGSLQDRLDFFEEKLPEIMDSADYPLTGKCWWKKSDEPWQTLASCMEVTDALRSEDPKSYVSHFPVHQDGSCNGLQHYAALGRDKQGAVQVNLEPSSMPQDVYSGIAELVERERKKDAAIGVKIAEVLEGFVSRRVVKQPVMTTVYGVTRYGAKLQIIRQLKDIPDFPQDYMFQAASYLVSKTFFSLREMFCATKEIQDWFTLTAGVISNVCGQPVEWETPIGLPIIQPYYKLRKMVYKKINNRNVKVYQENDQPNTRKQKNAFPPNYIHSLDSTHMMLTSLFCQKEGIAFVSVHDCFWTHPSTVAQMNRICREQFIALHSEPLLESLSEQLIKRYKENLDECDSPQISQKIRKILISVPEKGSFDLNRVLQSTYFFS